MMTPRNLRRFQRRLDDAIRLERNGAPPPPEIAARMTKPRKADVLYQVCVTQRTPGMPDRMIAVGPKMIRQACEEFAAAIHEQIAKGKELRWADPVVAPCLAVPL